MKNFIVLLIVCGMALPLAAQPKRSRLPKFNVTKENNVFLKKQWWLGFKAGANLSSPEVTKAYAAISPMNYPVADGEKTYEAFRDLGAQATLEITFYFSGLSLSVQPTYRNNRFVYTNDYVWADAESPTNRLTLAYRQEQRLDYFEIPLLAKYEFTKNKLGPYVQAGIFAATLFNAVKKVDVSGTDFATGGVSEFRQEPILVGARDLFAKNYWGFVAGIGTYYNLGNVRLNADVCWRTGMSNIVSTKNRFGNDRLAGIGDAMDDLRMKNISFTMGCLFPLRFIGKGFQSIEKSKR